MVSTVALSDARHFGFSCCAIVVPLEMRMEENATKQGSGVGTQPKNVACVGRYLGMNQNDVKHHLLPFLLDSAQFHHQYLAHIINDCCASSEIHTHVLD